MRLFRRAATPAPAPPVLPAAEEQGVRQDVRDFVDRRTQRSEDFAVLCVVPVATPGFPVTAPELELASRTIAAQLRAEDRYGPLDDGSYVVALAAVERDFADIVAQRLAVELTTRAAAVNARKWTVGIARFPHDAQTEAALIDLARKSAFERLAA